MSASPALIDSAVSERKLPWAASSATLSIGQQEAGDLAGGDGRAKQRENDHGNACLNDGDIK